MAIPLLLIFFAMLTSGLMAYGTHPAWARFARGLDMILVSRTLQWPLGAAAVLCCLALIALVIAGRRRAWWLIGLGPVLALFAHHYATDSLNQLLLVENPALVPASHADFLADDDYVVGLVFTENAYAYPYAALYAAPVVIQPDHDQRMILLWSASANRATAFRVGRDLKARDLEIVSIPAASLLLYNARLGQFISAVTGRTVSRRQRIGPEPTGFGEPLATAKMPWRSWRALHPETLVMAPVAPGGPSAPVLPQFRLRPQPGGPEGAAPIAVISTPAPIALRSDALANAPLNLTVGGNSLLVFRAPGGAVRAFDRRIEEDLYLRFATNRDRSRPSALLVDAESNTGWNADGIAVDGPRQRRGSRLTPIAADDGLYWDVMKYWYPDLVLQEVQAVLAAPAMVPADPQSDAPTPARTRPRSSRSSRRGGR